MKKIKYALPVLLAFLLIFAWQKYRDSSLAVKKDYYDYLCRQPKKNFFREEPSGGAVMVRPNRKYAWDFSFSREKEPGRKRIFIAGESVSYILHTPNGIFDNSKDPEFINLSMSGYDSSRVAPVFSESLKYSPDAVVVMSGNNETGDDPCSPGSLIKSGAGGEEAARETLARYEENLRGLKELSRERGVELFLCVLPVNLVYPPFGELPLDPLFLKAFKSWLERDYPGSERLFLEYLKTAPEEPFGNYYMGLVLRETKDYKKAEVYLQKAVSFDNRQDRASTEKNAVVRSLADGNGTYLIDLEAHLSRFSKGGVIDGTRLVDGVHWLDEGVKNDAQKFITEEMASKTKDDGLRASLRKLARDYASPGKSAAPPGYEPVNYAVTYMGFNQRMDERIIYMLASALGKGMISKKLSKEEVSALLRDNLWIKIKENSGLWWNRYLYYLAEVYLRRGEPASALELLRKADRSSFGPDYQDRYNLAYRLACSGVHGCSEAETARLSAYHFSDARYNFFLEIFSGK